MFAVELVALFLVVIVINGVIIRGWRGRRRGFEMFERTSCVVSGRAAGPWPRTAKVEFKS
jgi:hypothetical protein